MVSRKIMCSDFTNNYSVAADALRDFYLRSHRTLDKLMAAHGASFARTKIMSFIARGGKVRSTDLAEAFGFAPRTITEAVDALERDGMVLREPDLNDRRVKQISLTAFGEEVLKASEPERNRFGNRLFEVLEQDEIGELARLLGKLNSRLGELEQELEDAGGRGKK